MKIAIKADKPLFEGWLQCSAAVGNLKSIVQNDMHITSHQFEVWKKQALQAATMLNKLARQTIEHVEKGNVEKV